MADIRINALANTATSAASDDYLALDGSANGTRKILATNVAQNVTDVTLGSAGPSVKSSLSARAPRQGLVFDGTSGATVASVPALGTADFTFSAFVMPTNFSALMGIFGGALNSAALYVTQIGGFLRLGRTDVTDYTTSTTALVAGKTSHVAVVRSGATATYYVNGIAAGTADVTGVDFAVAQSTIGKYNTTSYNFNGAINQPLIYNRALSASEVVALYEAGAPAGADYNSASNTSLVTGDNSTFASDTGYWTKGNGATISGGKANLTGGANSNIYRTGLTVAGKRYRMTVTVDAADSVAYISDGNVTTLVSGTAAGFGTTGTKTFEFTVPSTASTGIQIISASGTLVLDNLLLYPLGLLLAPDAAQAGGGLTWYDTSGNSANITLPASGVSWNVPSSGVLGGNWTNTGNLTVSGTGNGITIAPTAGAANLVINGAAAGSTINFAQSGTNKYTLEYVSASNFWSIGRSGVAYDLVLKSGNLLIGTTTDGGQKLQVAGTAYVGSATATVNPLTVQGNGPNTTHQAGTATAAIWNRWLNSAGTRRGYYGYASSGDSTFTIMNEENGSFVIGTNSATALTLDGNLNATFAGTIKPQQAATASAPTYVKGAIYFDTTLNKLRVGGATGWETITSV